MYFCEKPSDRSAAQVYTCLPTEGELLTVKVAGNDELTCVSEDAEEKQKHRQSHDSQSHLMSVM